jgi:hypothetical protein
MSIDTRRPMPDSRQPMALPGYREADLVTNRATCLLFGGTEPDRRAWAEEASRGFDGEGFTVVEQPGQLADALGKTHGVVYVPDVAALPRDAQQSILRALLEREERPKLVLGLGATPQDAMAKGFLLDGLSFRLQQAQVDLSAAGVRDAIRARRAKAKAKADKQKPKKKH